MQQLESLVTAARDMAARQTRRYSQHMDKLSLADRVIQQLLSDNEGLLTSLLALQVRTDYFFVHLISSSHLQLKIPNILQSVFWLSKSVKFDVIHYKLTLI